MHSPRHVQATRAHTRRNAWRNPAGLKLFRRTVRSCALHGGYSLGIAGRVVRSIRLSKVQRPAVRVPECTMHPATLLCVCQHESLRLRASGVTSNVPRMCGAGGWANARPRATLNPPPVSNGNGCLTAVAPALVCNRIPTHWTVMCKYTVRACTGKVNPSVRR